MIPSVKSMFEEIPKPLGFLLSKIPYRLRPGIGSCYKLHLKEIAFLENSDIEGRKAFVLMKIREAVRQAIHTPFYFDLYRNWGVEAENIRSFNDIARIPVVTKEMLKAIPIEKRANRVRGRYITNTGGSSGSTLKFFITPKLIPNEWAHMHTIWAKLGYNQSMLKMTFGGRNLGDKNIAYDGLRHQFSINVYKGLDDILPCLLSILRRERIYYLHGYPSALAEFAVNSERDAPQVVDILRRTLRGAFLGSEYPAPMYRDRIESVFNIPTVSWYGHTERAILAWEKDEKFIYHPFQTYGYCEVIPNPDTGGWRLLGTSYNNFASPFIRYDTGDDVEPVEMRDGLLVSFRIRSGRLGEFVIDRQGVKIPLTALIFGRHHRLFDVAQFVQIQQKVPGEATVLVTPKERLPADFVFDEWFDRSGLDMKIDFQVAKKPVLSSSGKVVLKVV